MGPTMLAVRFQHSVTPNTLRSYLTEFLSTFFYVFAVVGLAMSSRKLMPDVSSDASNLVVVAVTNAFALSSAICWPLLIMASLLLKMTVVGQHVPTYTIAEEMTGFGASLMECILTFALVYTIYAAGDTRHGTLGAIGPLAIWFIAGANVLAAGPFSGGSKNPTCAFGSAVTTGNFKNQAVYWVGPLIGAAAADLVYDNVVFPSHAPEGVGL
ncbi:hypothetical protein FH972_025351 [Carpinus fangiana]|uniref:Aquaporin n=1 Tax=Carpinus fangiana TaxID=176857 RepID=A0A5N6L1S0_9ROSI|nr:hypothetical protein FH972_025351 [Carpinus fangiana]